MTGSLDGRDAGAMIDLMAQPEVVTASEEIAFRTALESAASAIGVHVDPHAVAKMWEHFLCMVRVNREINLTRITTPIEAAVKHYADSLALLACPGVTRDQPASLLDVGTGAGFPAVPLAVLCPAWRIVAIDGTGKKVRFLRKAVADLQLPNVQVHHARAADWRRSHRERFDRVLLRAVSKIAPGLEEVFPLVRPGGEVVFYKTVGIDHEEIEKGERAARKRGFDCLPPVEIQLPLGQEYLHRRLMRYQRRHAPA